MIHRYASIECIKYVNNNVFLYIGYKHSCFYRYSEVTSWVALTLAEV